MVNMFSRKSIFQYLFIFIVFLLASSAYSTGAETSCSDYKFSNNDKFVACYPLPVLNSFLHWDYYPSNQSINIAYRQTGVTDSNWIAWCLNPSGGIMVGSQCLIAFKNPSGEIRAYTSPITSYGTMLAEGPLSFDVPRLSGEFVNGEMIIYATIKLPSGGSKFTQVWQFGDVSGTRLRMHHVTGDHMKSFETINFAPGRIVLENAPIGAPSSVENNVPISTGIVGTTRSSSLLGKRLVIKNVHGVLNVVSWGIMMPFGVIIARYVKVFKIANPLWFYMHVLCQASGYFVGIAGWATGMSLGSTKPAGVHHSVHRNIGITIFTLGTLQVLAGYFLRPKPDAKNRYLWNIGHHTTGYTIIILSIINIFKGFDILQPAEKWKKAYIGVLIFFGACALVLEIYTWILVCKRKRNDSAKPQNTTDGSNNA